MAEKITMKDMLANLPQKTDVNTVVGRDASGNPVYIKKSDLAQVVAELMLRPILITDFTEMDSMTYENYNTKFFCYFNNTTPNSPFNNVSGIIFSFIFGSASVCQIVITNQEKIYIRSRYNDKNWNDWTRIGA
jgi:hypothetical protein